MASKQNRTGSAPTDSDSGWKGWRPSHPAFKAFTRPLHPASATTLTCTASNISGQRSEKPIDPSPAAEESSAHTRRQHPISDASRDPSLLRCLRCHGSHLFAVAWEAAKTSVSAFFSPQAATTKHFLADVS